MAQIITVAPPTGNPRADTDAINAAIKAANAAYAAYPAGGQVTVQLSTGTYVVTGDPTNPSVGPVELLSGVALVGAGMGSTTIQLENNFNARINGIVRTDLGDVSNVSVTNLTIDGNRANNTTGDPLKDHQAGFICGDKDDVQANITLTGVEIKNCTAYGFNPHEITSNVTITNCVSHGNGLDGFVADGVVGGTYANNIAYDNDRHGFNIQNASTNLTLKDNDAHANGSAGITVQRGNVLRDGAIEIQWNTNIQIIGGAYYGNTKEGILVKLSDSVTIDGASIHDNLRQGVRIEGATNTTLRNSTIYNNSRETPGAYDAVQIRLDTAHPDGKGPNDQGPLLPEQTYYSSGTQILSNKISPEDARYAIRDEPTNASGAAIKTVVSGNAIFAEGTSGADSFDGSTGGDEMRGLAGNDTYRVNHSGDMVVEAAGEGNDTVLSSINYTLGANVENLTLTGATAVRATGNELNNYLTGNALGNELEGKEGDDTLDGGAGADTMIGGNGNDTYYVDNAADIIVEKFTSGAGGVDQVYSSVSYILSDEIERLTLTGSANLNATGNSDANVLIGNSGANTLTGNAGNDILAGKGGNDLLEGGTGVDTAVYDSVRVTYTLSGNLQSRMVQSASEGTDTLTSVEVLQFLDGRVVYDVSDRAAVVYRLYDSAFNRTPDTFGFNDWIAALERGVGVNDIAASFVASAEFQATYGALSNQGFVEQLYRNVLGREGDAGGLAGWTDALNSGRASRGEVLVGFSESAEHIKLLRPAVEAGLWDQNEKATAVARLYHATLDRAPDAAGLAGWTKLVEGGYILQDVADGFVFSSEFQGKYGPLNNQQFVEQLYLNVLDRGGDAQGLAAWTNLLNSGQADRGDVVVGFSESTEFKIKMQPFFEGGILLA